jgi:hypothetical protein
MSEFKVGDRVRVASSAIKGLAAAIQGKANMESGFEVIA